jgi:hypothetical protein
MPKDWECERQPDPFLNIIIDSEDNTILAEISSPDDLSEASEAIEEGTTDDWGLI